MQHHGRDLFNYDTLAQRLRELAFLNKGLRITLTDEREDPVKNHEFHYEGGIAEFIKHLNRGKSVLRLADGKHIVTHQVGLPLLEAMGRNLQIHPKARVVDNGNLVFSAGVSAGTDAALYLVARLYGTEVALKTAQYMEYGIFS